MFGWSAVVMFSRCVGVDGVLVAGPLEYDGNVDRCSVLAEIG